MQTHTSVASLAAALSGERRAGRSIGFVPTMGALHEGHLTLVQRARAGNDVVVASIFVNPLQFGPTEDFERYPRDLAADARLLADAGVDHLFAPTVAEMYPAGALATRIEVGPIGAVGEGRYRPGFFAGVATVCVKLFNIVGADRAYFGEKDAQQLAVIRSVVADLNLPVTVVGCPTLREADGLAASSRNAYLTPAQRAAAPALSRALFAAQRAVVSGEVSAAAVRALVEGRVGAEPLLALQYVDVFDAETFAPVQTVDRPAVLSLAAFAGETRLIDNVALAPPVAPLDAGERVGEAREGIMVTL